MTFYTARSNPRNRSEGSVLVLTLLTVSLLLLVTMAFVALVRMDLRTVLHHQLSMQARAHARLGLELAISQLQETAGPDTRVTAPLLLGPATRPNVGHIARVLNSERFIQGATGLALNPKLGATEGYLLSHNPSQPFDPLTFWPFEATGAPKAGHTLLIGPGSVTPEDANHDNVPDGYVAVPLRTLPNGEYAYHVRDNGLRAQVNLSDPFRQSDQKMNHREQAITAQRMGSETILPGLDPNNPLHDLYLSRVLSAAQLDLTPFVDAEGSKGLFHGISLQSLGLPVNVARGGLKKDVTAVLREAEANGGQINSNGPQWLALRDHQEQTILRMRAETLALPGSQPASLATPRWNALKALTLRADQALPAGRAAGNKNSAANSPELREKIFPPLTDMNVRWDPAGPSWRQFLTHATLWQRLASNPSDPNSPIVSAQVQESQRNVTPVLARFSQAIYWTMDWPTLRVHFVPSIVLWNPYNVPMRVPPGQAWQFLWEFEPQHYHGFGISLKFRNPSWKGNQGLWSPTLRLSHQQGSNNAWYWFRLLDANGSPDVILPPGEAVFFTMKSHEAIPVDRSRARMSSDNWVNTHITRVPSTHRVDLYQGVHGFGGYSFYIEEPDVNDWMMNAAAMGPRNLGVFGSTTRWNSWDEAGFPFRIFTNASDPSAPDYTPNVNATAADPGPYHGSDYPPRHARNQTTDPGIAINVNGLSGNGWVLEDAAAVIRGREDSGSQFRSRGFHLSALPANNTSTRPSGDNWLNMPSPYMATPAALHNALPGDIDNPAKPNLLPYFGGRPPSFSPSTPFSDLMPAYPSWGLSWGLRMPDTSFSYNQTGQSGGSFSESANFGAPSRWLLDYNPTAPFQIQDPIGRTVGEGHRGGYMNPSSYVGGFTLDPDAFNLSQISFGNTGSQFIGYSDDLVPDGAMAPGWRPRLVLFEVPRSSEDLASIGSFLHANPHSTGHAWAYLTNNASGDFRRWMAAGNTTEIKWGPSTDIAPNTPVYPVGNSFAHILVPRDKAHHTYFPGPTSPVTPSESIPFASASDSPNLIYPTAGTASISFYPAYDLSYVLNTLLWDDFMLTPDSNRRLLWNTLPAPPRDFHDSASKVLVAGAFNVNSLSAQAWAALFSSLLDVELPNPGMRPEANTHERVAANRFLDPRSEAFSPASGDDYAHGRAYSGYRRLTLAEIQRLAEAMVEQVRLRGPFLSMGEFVNRRLIAEADDPQGLGLSGALQRAIQEAGLNDAMGQDGDTPIWMKASQMQGLWQGVPGTNAFHGMSLGNAEGSRGAGAPGFLMQGDLLARLGSALTVRSDTFTVRAYGSVGSSDQPTARAWIEAVIQRTPDFVDPSNPPDALPKDLSGLNALLGRRFRVISLKWLNENEM